MSAVRPSQPATTPGGPDDHRAANARAERRRQILEAAKAVFAEAGYHAASINAIIERAQIARGTFYLYFDGKAAVFDSLLDQAMSELRGRIHRIDVEDPSAPPPQVQLRDGLVRVLEYVVSDHALATILLTTGQTAEAEAADRLATFFDEIRQIIVLALEHGIAMKLVRPCNVELAAAGLLGSVRGVVEMLIDPARATAEPISTVVGDLIALCLRGVLAI